MRKTKGTWFVWLAMESLCIEGWIAEDLMAVLCFVLFCFSYTASSEVVF